jgi:hypothetical protein
MAKVQRASVSEAAQESREARLAGSARTLGDVSRELASWVPILRQLAEAEALRNLALGHSFEISGATIRSIISARRLREDFFWPAMSESAWGIMLELFASRLAGERLTVATLAAASDTAPDATLHWADWLAGRKLVSRDATAPDAMDATVTLTETGADQMRAYLIAALRLSPWVQ